MSKATILIVEDEIIISQAAKMSLQNLGYDVVDSVVTGEEAVERARELRPDLILMDIFLPGKLDGVETAAIIQREMGTPIIFATALGDEDTIQRARATEPYGFIIKPYDKSDLRGAIEMALQKAEAERKVRENERWLTMTMDNMRDAIITTDAEGVIRSVNPVACGYMQDPVGKRLNEVVRIDNEGGADLLRIAIDDRRELSGACVLSSTLNEWFPADITFKPIFVQPDDELLGFLFTYADITERRKQEQEREDLIEELQTALENVKTLSGMLPICAHCKKIRDDSGYWKQVEEYISVRSDVEFSHGLCPDCARKLYPEVYDKKKKKT